MVPDGPSIGSRGLASARRQATVPRVRDDVVAENLGIIALGVAAAILLITLVESRVHGAPLTPTYLGVNAVFASVIGLAWLGRRHVPPRWASPQAALLGLGGLALLRTAFAAATLGDPMQVVYVLLVALAAGGLFASHLAFAAIAGATLVVGVALALQFPDAMDRADVLTALVVSSGFGLIVYSLRQETFRRLGTAMDALHVTQSRFEAATTGARDGIWDLDTRTGALHLSARCVEILGFRAATWDEFTDRWHACALSGADDARARAAWAALTEAHEKFVDAEFRLRHPDGTERWVSLRGAGMRDASGAVTRLAGSVTDVTERMKTERLLHQNEKLTALGTLVAGVAHEVNNPLQVMLGHADLSCLELDAIAARDDLDAETRASVEQVLHHQDRIRKSVAHLAHVTRSLKHVARADTGARVVVDLNGVVEDVLTVASPRIGPNVRIVRDLQAHAPVEANANGITQVLLNLVMNAADAMAGTDGVLTVRSRDDAEGVTVEVEDSGVGIPPVDEARVFDPFFTTKEQGTGLGLSVSHGIVSDHGGTLAFRPGAERGTVFAVTLPTRAVTAVPPLDG